MVSNRSERLEVPVAGRGGRPPAVSAALSAVCIVLALAATACPIQRPPVPDSYQRFRYQLELAVRDTAMEVLAERPAARDRLEGRLTELSALLVVDSLVARLRSDPLLGDLGAAVEATVHARLEADGVGADVREGFESATGQRLACDAILVGLGRAAHLLR